jgi:hypothetical protein
MSDEFWRNLAAIISAIGVIFTSVVALLVHRKVTIAEFQRDRVERKVDVIDRQTNGINQKMVETAETATPLPIVMAPAPSKDAATAEQIRLWIALGVELGAKARREAERGTAE